MTTRERTPVEKTVAAGFDTCLACGRDFGVTRAGELRVHGPPNARCRGSRSYGARLQRTLKEGDDG